MKSSIWISVPFSNFLRLLHACFEVSPCYSHVDFFFSLSDNIASFLFLIHIPVPFILLHVLYLYRYFSFSGICIISIPNNSFSFCLFNPSTLFLNHHSPTPNAVIRIATFYDGLTPTTTPVPRLRALINTSL